MEIGIVGLLRAAWLAGTFPLMVALLPFPGLSWIHRRIMVFALRGKTMQTSTRFTVPQRLFSHFYLLAVLWTLLLLGATWIYAHNEELLAYEPFSYSAISSHLTEGSHIFSFHKSHSSSLKHRYKVWKSVFLLLLMEIQVSRRLYESIHVFNYSPSARMHIMGYLTGIFFYTAAPLSLCCNILPDVLTYWEGLISEFIVRGKAQMPPVEFNLRVFVISPIELGWRQWIGTAIFLWGWIHQHRCHKILGSLRENREQSEEYVIPHGDWFQVVSCPHYLAEIVIYSGLFVASGASDVTILLVLVFVLRKPIDGISISLRIIPKEGMPSFRLLAKRDRFVRDEIDMRHRKSFEYLLMVHLIEGNATSLRLIPCWETVHIESVEMAVADDTDGIEQKMSLTSAPSMRNRARPSIGIVKRLLIVNSL